MSGLVCAAMTLKVIIQPQKKTHKILIILFL